MLRITDVNKVAIYENILIIFAEFPVYATVLLNFTSDINMNEVFLDAVCDDHI